MFDDRDLGVLGAGALLSVLCLLLPFSFAGKVALGCVVLVGFMSVELPTKLAVMLWVVVVAALFASIVLFWAVRVRSSGAVLVGSLLTAALLSPWLFHNPFPPRLVAFGEAAPIDTLRGIPVVVLEWLWTLAVLAAAAVILFLYARQRLQRPESML